MRAVSRIQAQEKGVYFRGLGATFDSTKLLIEGAFSLTIPKKVMCTSLNFVTSMRNFQISISKIFFTYAYVTPFHFMEKCGQIYAIHTDKLRANIAKSI